MLKSQFFFLTAIWLPHGQLWAIIGGDSLTHPMLITAFYIFDPRVTGSLVARLGPVSLLNLCEIYTLTFDPFVNSFLLEFFFILPKNFKHKTCINNTNRKLEEIFRPKQVCRSSPYGSL